MFVALLSETILAVTVSKAQKSPGFVSTVTDGQCEHHPYCPCKGWGIVSKCWKMIIPFRVAKEIPMSGVSGCQGAALGKRRVTFRCQVNECRGCRFYI